VERLFFWLLGALRVDMNGRLAAPRIRTAIRWPLLGLMLAVALTLAPHSSKRSNSSDSGGKGPTGSAVCSDRACLARPMQLRWTPARAGYHRTSLARTSLRDVHARANRSRECSERGGAARGAAVVPGLAGRFAAITVALGIAVWQLQDVAVSGCQASSRAETSPLSVFRTGWGLAFGSARVSVPEAREPLPTRSAANGGGPSVEIAVSFDRLLGLVPVIVVALFASRFLIDADRWLSGCLPTLLMVATAAIGVGAAVTAIGSEEPWSYPWSRFVFGLSGVAAVVTALYAMAGYRELERQLTTSSLTTRWLPSTRSTGWRAARHITTAAVVVIATVTWPFLTEKFPTKFGECANCGFAFDNPPSESLGPPVGMIRRYASADAATGDVTNSDEPLVNVHSVCFDQWCERYRGSEELLGLRITAVHREPVAQPVPSQSIVSLLWVRAHRRESLLQ
jgi:hypothetical protein